MKTKMYYELVPGLYGTPEPSIRVYCPEGTGYKHVMAELHRLTAKVYKVAACVASQYGWSPEPRLREDGSAAGRVRIELDEGTPEEIALAEHVLKLCMPAR